MQNFTQFNSLLSLSDYFNTELVCHTYLAKLRWKNIIICPYENCDGVKIYQFSAKKRHQRYKCIKCRKQFTAKIGTIFEKSKLPLRKWFMAIYMITSHTKGISSVQLSKDIGVTQKTAWYMTQKIKQAFQVDNETPKLSGEVEVDETYVGG